MTSAVVGAGAAVAMILLVYAPINSHSYWFDVQSISNCPPPALSCASSTTQYREYFVGDWITFAWRMNVSGPIGVVDLYNPSGQQVYSSSGSAGSGTYLVSESTAGEYGWYIATSGNLTHFELYFFGNVTWYTPLF